MADKIHIDGHEISIKLIDDQDFISLTDIARRRENREPIAVIRSWLRNSSTLLYLEAWEKMHNPNFKVSQMGQFKIDAFEGRDLISPKKYIDTTDAIGIISKSGRYGGTFAHRDIAFEFASWIEPVFKLYLITEFQRLKSEEYQRKKLEWDYGRFLSKVNYQIQTESIKDHIVPRLQPGDKSFVYATEADLVNLAVFGMTAKQWREKYPDAKGNIRDHANIIELTVLANLESINAMLIEAGASKEARMERLLQVASSQLHILSKDDRLDLLDE